MGIFGFFNKDKKETLDKGLQKTKTSVFDKLARAVAGKSKVEYYLHGHKTYPTLTTTR